MTCRFQLFSGLLVGVALSTGAAIGQTSAPDIAARRELIRHAQEEGAAGHHREALDLATRAGRIAMSASLRAFIAHEQAELGMLAEALGNAEECLRETSGDEHMADRTTIVSACRGVQAAVEPRIAHIVLRIAQPPTGLRVVVAGNDVNSALYGVPYVVTPGPLTVSADAPGFAHFETLVQVGAGQTPDVTIALRALLSSLPPPTTVSSSPPPPGGGQFVAVHRGGVPIGAFLLGGLGLAGIGFGIFAGVESDGFDNRAFQNGALATDTNLTRGQNLSASGTWRWVEAGSLVGGGVLVLVGTLVGIFGRDRLEARVTHAAVVPIPGGGMLSIGGNL